MKLVTQEEIEKILYSMDSKYCPDNVDEYIDSSKPKYLESIEKLFLSSTEDKSVLGFDIYKYSQYLDIPQYLIPFLIKIMLDKTVEAVNKYELFIFGGSFVLSGDNHIDTGDGGFIIFDTPLHALAFALHMSIFLKQFNTYIVLPVTRDIIKSVDIRFALTYDKTFHFNKNSYGTSIINNARILSKDKLNRCLFDEKTNEWFLKNINGIEILRSCSYAYLHQVNSLRKYLKPGLIEDKLGIFSKQYNSGVQIYGIDKCDIQKIGIIQAKKQELSIYSLHIQAQLAIEVGENPLLKEPIVITLGNLNTNGLTE